MNIIGKVEIESVIDCWRPCRIDPVAEISLIQSDISLLIVFARLFPLLELGQSCVGT